MLIPMTPAEFAEYAPLTAAGFARDKVTAGDWAPDAARGLAEAAIKTLLPQGIGTAGHYLYTIRDEATGARVGTLWYAEEARSGTKMAFVYDVHIGAEYRRQGHARRAFYELEEEARARGYAGVALHVFGHNTGAQELYRSLGYGIADLTLFKSLAPADDEV